MMSQSEASGGVGLPLPKATPMPEALTSNVPGTWAYDTMARRIREEILQRVIDDNKDVLDGASLSNLKDLQTELETPDTTPLRHIQVR